jgi:hypothetical protein
MTAEIEAAGGTVEKFAGDAVMAAFGAPEALEDHAERALHAALAMQHRVEGLRIGVNTGALVSRRARSPARSWPGSARLQPPGGHSTSAGRGSSRRKARPTAFHAGLSCVH